VSSIAAAHPPDGRLIIVEAVLDEHDDVDHEREAVKGAIKQACFQPACRFGVRAPRHHPQWLDLLSLVGSRPLPVVALLFFQTMWCLSMMMARS